MEESRAARVNGTPLGYVMAELRKSFRPEFLHRIDKTILSKPPTLEEITSIVDLLLIDLNNHLADRRVTVKLDKQAKEWAAEKGYDPVFGARPLKRYLQRNLETKLARALIAGEIGEGAAITFTVPDDELAPVPRVENGIAHRKNTFNPPLLVLVSTCFASELPTNFAGVVQPHVAGA